MVTSIPHGSSPLPAQASDAAWRAPSSTPATSCSPLTSPRAVRGDQPGTAPRGAVAPATARRHALWDDTVESGRVSFVQGPAGVGTLVVLLGTPTTTRVASGRQPWTVSSRRIVSGFRSSRRAPRAATARSSGVGSATRSPATTSEPSPETGAPRTATCPLGARRPRRRPEHPGGLRARWPD
jgi:hypothetical protein